MYFDIWWNGNHESRWMSSRKDVLEGFEDVGEFVRKSKLAKHALLVMLRGLYSNSKIFIAFHFIAKRKKPEQLTVNFNSKDELKSC